MQKPLMPKATAVWLVDNTTLTFDQIAEFCGLHTLEVQGIADGEVAANIVGLDPVANNQLTREEIERCEKDPSARLKLKQDEVSARKRPKGPRYTPVSKRQDRPDAIAWLLAKHPELSDAQISRLIGTTKQTISAIRDRTHWNMSNITPRDPVSLELCSQQDLDEVIREAARRLERQQAKARTAQEAEAAQVESPDASRADHSDQQVHAPEKT
ncbi:MAG: DUF1013 domain-containing protein [Alphaproteobacteria bacterium]|nr:MAG: DUF1013 domain-containing protein [Alphaproteobacteria bacterium]